jgi:hypothetical protein
VASEKVASDRYE